MQLSVIKSCNTKYLQIWSSIEQNDPCRTRNDYNKGFEVYNKGFEVKQFCNQFNTLTCFRIFTV